MNVLNAAKPLPVYMQIAELLARQIKAGYWRGDERLPTEAELAQTLGVAIGTLRKGLALLEQQGVLERIQGSGTYVRSGAGKQQIYELFRLELTDGPGFPTARVLELSRQARPAGVPAMDPDGPGACWRVRRLRYLRSSTDRFAPWRLCWLHRAHLLDRQQPACRVFQNLVRFGGVPLYLPDEPMSSASAATGLWL